MTAVVCELLTMIDILGLERKISMRTSKEELIQRGILLPGEATSSPSLSVSSSTLQPAPFPDQRPSSPRLNLPQLLAKPGRKSFMLYCPVLSFAVLSNW